jgi:Domain of unknown function (DUF4105)
MNKLLLQKTFLYLFLLISFNSFSQYYKLTNQAKISVLTCGSGNELYSIYGHTGLRVVDVGNNLDIVFNYGNFDFATTNFYLKFVKGDLQYFVAACSFQDFMYEYQVTNRQVWEQNLLISDIQKQQLFDEINKTLYSNEKFYTYKFIDKNCTTMVLDKINSVFGSEIVTKKTNVDISYRKVLFSFLDNHFWENFGINIIFGHKVDNDATKLFLPEELMSNISTSKFNNKPIAEKSVIINKKKSEISSFSFLNSIYPYLIFLVLIVLFNKKQVNLIYFSILGILGIFFSTVFIYSQHEEIYWNYNILLFNPSLLILVNFILQKNQKWTTKLCYFNMACLGIYILILLNKVHLLMMLPMIFCSGIILYRIILENKKVNITRNPV